MFKLKIKYRHCPEMNEEIICATFWTTQNMTFLHYKTSLDSHIEHVIDIRGVICDIFIGPNEMPERKRWGAKTKLSEPDFEANKKELNEKAFNSLRARIHFGILCGDILDGHYYRRKEYKKPKLRKGVLKCHS